MWSASKKERNQMLLNEEIRKIANSVDEGQEDSEFLIAFAHAVEKRVTTELEEKNDVWKMQAQVAIENLTGQTWIWQGDGEDHLETMSNSMIVAIRADQLKEMIQSLSAQADILASALGKCILASGMVSKDKTGFSGPELLLLAEDLKELLLRKHQPAQQATVPTVQEAVASALIPYRKNYQLMYRMANNTGDDVRAAIYHSISVDIQQNMIPSVIRELSQSLRPAQQPFNDDEFSKYDVRKILLDVVPGDGSGSEVYAKSIEDVKNKLTELDCQLEEWELGIKKLTKPKPNMIVLSDGRKLVYKDLVYHGYGLMGWVLQTKDGEEIRRLNKFEVDFVESALNIR